MTQGGSFKLALTLLLALAAVAPVHPASSPDGAREEAPRPDVGTDAPPELQIALSFDPSPRLQAFVNLDLSQEVALTAAQGEEGRLNLGLKEAFLLFKDLAPGRLALQVGRQRFKDEREWLYDEDLDAVRVFWQPSGRELQLSISRHGFYRTDFLDEASTGQTNNYLVYGRYRLGKALVPAAYVFVRDDRSPARECPVFFGLQAGGALGDALDVLAGALPRLGPGGVTADSGVGRRWRRDLCVRPALPPRDDGRLCLWQRRRRPRRSRGPSFPPDRPRGERGAVDWRPSVQILRGAARPRAEQPRGRHYWTGHPADETKLHRCRLSRLLAR